MNVLRRVGIAAVGVAFRAARLKLEIYEAIGLVKLPYLLQLWAYRKLQVLPADELAGMHEGLDQLVEDLGTINGCALMECERLLTELLEASTKDELVGIGKDFVRLFEDLQARSLETSLDWLAQAADRDTDGSEKILQETEALLEQLKADLSGPEVSPAMAAFHARLVEDLPRDLDALLKQLDREDAERSARAYS